MLKEEKVIKTAQNVISQLLRLLKKKKEQYSRPNFTEPKQKRPRFNLKSLKFKDWELFINFKYYLVF